MKLPRDISGEKVVSTLVRHWGYVQIHRVGSHIILQTKSPRHHRLSVPNHDPLKIGTLNAILRQVADAKNVGRDQIVATL